MVEPGDEAHRTALSAWRGLVETGGVEPDGRDLELADGLRQTLDADAESVEEALETSSMAAFVEALFGAVEPFAMMFRDILRFFESAGARDGQRQWRLVVGDEVFDLEHFQEFERPLEQRAVHLDPGGVDEHRHVAPGLHLVGDDQRRHPLREPPRRVPEALDVARAQPRQPLPGRYGSFRCRATRREGNRF